jgi:hypothetical protein
MPVIVRNRSVIRPLLFPPLVALWRRANGIGQIRKRFVPSGGDPANLATEPGKEDRV